MQHITPEQYATRVASRSSKEFHDDLVPGPVLAVILTEIVENAKLMDIAKKALFYGQLGLEYRLKYAIIAGKYGWEPKDGILAMPKPVSMPPDIQQTLHAVIGIITEAGELAEALIKAFGSVQMDECSLEDAFDHINLREEYGDVLWYAQLGLSAIGSSIPECMTVNDNKLEKRYGPTFSADRANNRDLDGEREELKKC